MKKFIAIVLLLIAAQVQAATAYFTGRQELVQSVTYQWVWNCQYQYAGHTFWRAFAGSCPGTVEVY